MVDYYLFFRKLLQNSKAVALLMVLLLSSLLSEAQVSWSNLTSTNLSQCSSSGDFRIWVQNATPTADSNITIRPSFPAGVTIVALSIVDSSSFPTGGITFNGTDFIITNPVPSSGIVDIRFKLTANCASAVGTKSNNYSFRISGTPAGSAGTSNAYSINNAVLSITSVTNTALTNVNVLDSFSQCVTVINGGNGTLDSLTLNLDSAAVSFSNLSITTGGATVPATFILGTNGKVRIFPTTPLALNSSIQLCYTVKIRRCTPSTRSISASWGCGGSNCITSNIVSSGFTINAAAPVVTTISREIGTANSCIIGQTRNYQSVITNTGTVPANLSMVQFGNMNDGGGAFASWQTTVMNLASLVITTYTSGVPSSYTIPSGVLGTGSDNNAVNTGNCAHNQPGGYQLNWGTTNPYILPVGDSIVINWSQTQCDNTGGDCSVTPVSSNFHYKTATSYYSLNRGTWAYYSNQCGSGSYNTWSIAVNSQYNLSANIKNNSVPAQVVGATTFKVSGNAFISNYISPGGSNRIAQVDIQVPSGISLVSGSYLLATGSCGGAGSASLLAGYPLMLSGAGPGGTNIIRFRYNATAGGAFNTNNVNWSATLSNSGAVCGIQNIVTTATGAGDTTCAGYARVIQCVTSAVNFVCPSATCASASPISTYNRRVTRGLPDNDLNCLPDATGSLDTTKISLNYFRSNDTLRTYMKYAVFTDATNPNWNIAQADYRFNQGKWNIAGSPSIALKRGSSKFNINGSTIQVGATQQDFVASWNSSLPVGWGTYQAGDTIEVQQDYVWVDPPTNTPYFNTVVQGALTQTVYMAQSAPATGIWTYTGAAKNSCLSLNYDYYLTGYTMATVSVASSTYSTNGCTNINFSVQINNAGPAYSFPYEYRPIAAVDTISVNIPTGYSFLNTSFVGLPYGTVAGVTPTIANVDAFRTISGTKVTYNLRGMASALSMYPIANTNSFNLNFNVTPTPCVAASTSLPVHGAIRALIYSQPNLATDSILYNNTTGTLTNTKVSQTISVPVKSKTPPSGSDSFAVILTNTSPTVSILNTWIYLKGINGNIAFGSVKKNGVVVTPTSGGFYSLGNLAIGANNSLIIYASLTSCTADSFKVYYGGDCGGVPASFAAIGCKDSSILNLNPNAGGIQALLQPLNDGVSYNFCAPFTVTFDVNSTVIGDAKNITADFTLPVGLSYVPSSVRYKFPSSASTYTTSAYAPTLTGSTLHFNITGGSSITSSILTDSLLTGVYNTTKSTVKVQFQLASSCGVSEGAAVPVQFKGNNGCGSPLSSVGLTTSSLVFNDFPVPNYLTYIVDSRADTIKSCTAGSNVHVIIKNLGPAVTSKLDIIKVTLPNPVQFQSYDTVAGNVHNGPAVLPGVIYNFDNTSTLSWPLMDSVAVNDSVVFNFKTSPNMSLTSWPESNILISVGRTITKTCGTDTCLVYSFNGNAQVLQSINIPATLPLSLVAAGQQKNLSYQNCSDGAGALSFFDTLSNGKIYMKIFPNGNTGYNFTNTAINLNTQASLHLNDACCYATAIMPRAYQVVDAGTNNYTVNGGMKVRLYYAIADTTNALAILNTNTVPNVNTRFRWFKRSGTYAQLLPAQVAGGIAGAQYLVPTGRGIEGNLNYVEFSGITSFSTFGGVAYEGATPLPIKLEHFDVIPNSCGVDVNWKTAMEQHLSSFSIEMSEDGGRNYAILKEVSATNSYSGSSYTKSILGLSSGIKLFRLKMSEQDGSSTYGPTVAVTLNCQNGVIKVYPTDNTTGILKVELPEGYEQAEISLINSLGQKLAVSMMVRDLYREVNLKGLPSSSYILIINNIGERNYFKVNYH